MRESVGSTNDELASLAADGAGEGAVIAAEHQTSGRGRVDRVWTSPPRAGIAASMLLRPDVAQARWSWLPLLAGVAAVETIAELTVISAALKWPNDVLLGAGRGKGVGILADVVGSAVILGVGVNVTVRREELPRDDATSLALEGADADRTELLAGLLDRVERWYARWSEAGGDPSASGLAAAYAARCESLGRQVTVSMPDGTAVRGLADRIDADGRLRVETGDGAVSVAAGDVRHVRLNASTPQEN